MRFSASGAKAPAVPLPQAATTRRGRVIVARLTTSCRYRSRTPSTWCSTPPGIGRPSPPSTISFRRPISSGPKVSGFFAPIFTPVQPFSLWLAVTMATQGASRSNWAK